MWELLSIGHMYKMGREAGRPGLVFLLSLILFGIFFKPIMSFFSFIGVVKAFGHLGLLNRRGELDFLQAFKFGVVLIILLIALAITTWFVLLVVELIRLFLFDKEEDEQDAYY